MAHINITPYKLGKAHKTAIKEHVKGRVNALKTANRLGIGRTRLRVMLSTILVHSCTTGRINIEEVLKDY
jgi:hypothetical protein